MAGGSTTSPHTHMEKTMKVIDKARSGGSVNSQHLFALGSAAIGYAACRNMVELYASLTVCLAGFCIFPLERKAKPSAVT